MSTNYQEVTNQLYNALLDPAVAKNTELYGMLQEAKKGLGNKEPENQVFSKLSRSLTLYLLANQFEVPVSVSEILASLQKIEQTYRSQAHLALMVGSLFGGKQ